MFKFAAQPLGAWRIMGSSLSLYKQTFSRTWYLFILFLIRPINYFIGCLFGYNFNFCSFQTKPLTIETFTSRQFAAYFAASLVVSLILLYTKCITLVRINDLVSKPRTSLATSAKTTISKYFPVLGNQIVVYFIISVLVMPLLLPGIFVGILMLFSLPLILFSKNKPMEAIKNSCGLVWGNWLHTCWSVIFPLLAFLLIGTYSPCLLGYGVHGKILAAILALISCFFLIPWFWATILVLFNDLKLRAKLK
ncbi:MAG: hypothetical protein WCW01_05265 [Gammaproteobacteria bacterium]